MKWFTIYKFSLALKWPRFGIEILSVSQFSSLFIIIEELFRMIYPKGHPVARQEGRVLFNPSQTCADPSRSPPMMPTTNHSTGSVWSTEPVCRSSAPYLNHNPWVLTRCSHEIAFVRIDDTWAHQNNLEELVFLLRSMSFDLDTYYLRCLRFSFRLRCLRSSKIFYWKKKDHISFKDWTNPVYCSQVTSITGIFGRYHWLLSNQTLTRRCYINCLMRLPVLSQLRV